MTVGREHPRPMGDDWRARAACRGMGDVFFPEPGTDANEVARLRARARDICAGCPVKDACLEWGRANVTAQDVEAGAIFGGVSARTIKRWRDRARRDLPAIVHGTYGGYYAHKRRGEDACEACAEARRAYDAERRAAS